MFLLLFVIVAFSEAQTLLVENFEYPIESDILSQGWSMHSGAGNNDSITVVDGLTFDGYIGSGIGGAALLDSYFADQNKKFEKQTTGNIYVAFMVNVTNATINGDYFLNVGANPLNSYFGRVFVMKDFFSGKIAFGIQYTSTTGETIAPRYTSYIYNLSTTYQIVLKYVIDGASSYTAIIVNPILNQAEPTKGWISDKLGTTAKPDNIGSIALRQGAKGYAPTLIIDGIRVTTSWPNISSLTELSSTIENCIKVTISGNKLVLENSMNETQMDIYNLFGCKVQSSIIEKGSVDISSLLKGIYIIRIEGYSQKIII
ncbi:MAG: hypothetical protein WCJ61_05490 [Paludibacter sp.]